MENRIFILKIDEPDFSQLFTGAVISDNPMIAMSTLLAEVKSETNDECDLSKVELLEFTIKAA